MMEPCNRDREWLVEYSVIVDGAPFEKWTTVTAPNVWAAADTASEWIIDQIRLRDYMFHEIDFDIWSIAETEPVEKPAKAGA